jgi:hypothetical protein
MGWEEEAVLIEELMAESKAELKAELRVEEVTEVW